MDDVGVSYDTTEYWVRVNVQENTDGVLEASIVRVAIRMNSIDRYSAIPLNIIGEYIETEKTIEFVNKYTSSVFPSVGATGTQLLYMLSGAALVTVLTIYYTTSYLNKRRERSH